MKVLSIVIPTYNMEKYLHKCLNSLVLLDQESLSQLEVLVINDGSKDTSSRIAHDYEEKHPQIFRVIDKENGNYGSCINRGLKEAKGKYVKILDADDYFEKDSLKEYVKFLSTIDFDLVLSPYIKVNEKGDVLNEIKFGVPEKVQLSISDERLNPVLFSKHFQMHAVTYKTKIFKELGYIQSEGISYTDQEWMFLPMTKVETITYFPEILYCYLLGREGQTMDMQTQIRQVGHHMKGTIKMIMDYNSDSGHNEEHKNYLIHRLNRRVSEIYKICLLYKLPQEDLINFDGKIQELNSEYYKQLDTFVLHTLFPHHYIKYWHLHKDTSFVFIIYRFVKRFWKNY